MKKPIIVIVLVLALLALVGLIFGVVRAGSHSKAASAGSEVLEGTLESEEIDISTKIPGRLGSILVDEGDFVHAGQTVAVLESKEIRAKVEQATGMLEAAKAQQQQAVIGVELQAKQAADQVQQAEAGYNAARAKLQMALNGARPQEIAQAEAGYKAASARYQMAVKGARPQEIEQAQKAYDQSVAQYETAKATYDRFHGLYKEGVIPKQKEDEIDLVYRSAQAQMEGTAAKLSLVKEGARKEDIEQAKQGMKAAAAVLSQAREGARKEDIEAARQGVKAAQAQLRLAKDAFLQIDLRRQDVLAAGFKSQAAKGQLDEANAYAGETTIRSPIDGYVSERMSDPGEMVAAGFPILSIVKSKDFKLKVYADESKFGYLQIHDPVVVKIPSLGDAEYRGVVARVSQAADFAVKKATNEQGSFDVRALELVIKLQGDPSRLRNGMTARATIPKGGGAKR